MPPRPGGVAIAAMTSVSAGLDTRAVMQEAARGWPMTGFSGSDRRDRPLFTAYPDYRSWQPRAAASRSSTRFMCHCWKICSELLISQ